jgi:predicted GNAT family acetyltransferase
MPRCRRLHDIQHTLIKEGGRGKGGGEECEEEAEKERRRKEEWRRSEGGKQRKGEEWRRGNRYDNSLYLENVGLVCSSVTLLIHQDPHFIASANARQSQGGKELISPDANSTAIRHERTRQALVNGSELIKYKTAASNSAQLLWITSITITRCAGKWG